MADGGKSIELPGLEVVLDRLEYHRGGPQVPSETPHVFVYFLTIRNGSDRRVRLLGRKWIVIRADGARTVIEGDKIVGETPDLRAGESFSYNSFHITADSATVEGSFHGIDEHGNRVHVRIPRFALRVPRES